MKLKLLLLLLSISLASCSGVIYTTPAKPTQVQNSFNFNIPYDKAWLYSVDWFAENNITIDQIQKESGLLSAKYDVKLHPNSLDCGDVKPSTLASMHIYRVSTKINFTVREIDKENTRISINISGSYYGEGRDNGWGKRLIVSGQCYSTGTFEQSVASYISSKI